MAKNKGKTPPAGAKQSQTGKKNSQSGPKPVTKSAKSAATKKTAPKTVPKTASKPAAKPAPKKPAAVRPEPRKQHEPAAAASSMRRRKDAARPTMSSLDYACLAAGAALAAYGVFIFARIEFAGANAKSYLLGVLAFTGGVLLACLGSPAVRSFLVPARDPMENYEVVTPGSDSRERFAAAVTATQKPPATQPAEEIPEQPTIIENVEQEPEPSIADSHVQNKDEEDK